MPARKKRAIFVEHKLLSPQELETVLSGTDKLPWFGAVVSIIRQEKSQSMDCISLSASQNNPLAMSYGAGGMDFADALIDALRAACSPKPE